MESNSVQGTNIQGTLGMGPGRVVLARVSGWDGTAIQCHGVFMMWLYIGETVTIESVDTSW